MRIFIFCCFFSSFLLYGDELPSWNEGNIKKSILDFVQKVTDEKSEDYVPPEDRIATFDQDGTLWVEQPLPVELFFAIERSKTPLDKEKLAHLSEGEIEKLVAETHTGMTTDAFTKIVDEWIKKALHPRFKVLFTNLVYQPMLEVIHLLAKHQFKIFIVSGGGQDFIRAFSDRIYQIPTERVIGTAGKVQYTYKNQQPVLLKLPEVLFIDDKKGKPEGIHLIIGKKPIAAFGNSTGDKEMLEWAESGTKHPLLLLVHHDDPVREYAYDKDVKIGTFSDALMNEAKERKWHVVSMKNDWKKIFSWEKPSDK